VRRVDAEQRLSDGGAEGKAEMSAPFADAVEQAIVEMLVAPLFEALQLLVLAEAMEVLEFDQESAWRYWSCVFGGSDTGLPSPIGGTSDASNSRAALVAITSQFRLDGDETDEQLHDHGIAQQLLRHATASGHVRWALLLSTALDDAEAAVHILTHFPATFSVFDTLGSSVGKQVHRDFIERLRAQFSFSPPAPSPRRASARRAIRKEGAALPSAADEEEEGCYIQ
jgi:hypothetical protein